MICFWILWDAIWLRKLVDEISMGILKSWRIIRIRSSLIGMSGSNLIMLKEEEHPKVRCRRWEAKIIKKEKEKNWGSERNKSKKIYQWMQRIHVIRIKYDKCTSNSSLISKADIYICIFTTLKDFQFLKISSRDEDRI